MTRNFSVEPGLSSTMIEGIGLDVDRMIVESTVTENGTENGLTEIEGISGI